MEDVSITIQLTEEQMQELNKIVINKHLSVEEIVQVFVKDGLDQLLNPIIYTVREKDIEEIIEDSINRTPTEIEIKHVLDEVGGLMESISESVYPVLEDEISTAIEDLNIQ